MKRDIIEKIDGIIYLFYQNIHSPALHEDCTPDLEFRDSVTFQQCKSQALRRLAERPPPYIDSRYSKVDNYRVSQKKWYFVEKRP